MATVPQHILGQLGEKAAREYLASTGYAIVASNMQWGGVEIDFLAQKDNWLVFVEVKTRTVGGPDPLMQVTEAQRRRLLQAAASYVRVNNLRLAPRIDFITFTATPAPDGKSEPKLDLKHHPDAIRPSLRTYGRRR